MSDAKDPTETYFRPDLADVFARGFGFHADNVEARVGHSFGTEELPAGLRTVIGHARPT